MSLNSSIISEMEGVIDDPFFSETIKHNFPTANTEELTVIWDEPISTDEDFQSYLPQITLKTSDAHNVDKSSSRFFRGAKVYKCNRPPFAEQSGLTKIELTEVES